MANGMHTNCFFRISKDGKKIFLGSPREGKKLSKNFTCWGVVEPHPQSRATIICLLINSGVNALPAGWTGTLSAEPADCRFFFFSRSKPRRVVRIPSANEKRANWRTGSPREVWVVVPDSKSLQVSLLFAL